MFYVIILYIILGYYSGHALNAVFHKNTSADKYGG